MLRSSPRSARAAHRPGHRGGARWQQQRQRQQRQQLQWRRSHVAHNVAPHALRPRPLGGRAVAVVVVADATGSSSSSSSSSSRSGRVAQPANFDLRRAITLAGFAFEAYNSPKGGTVLDDGRGTTCSYLSPYIKERHSGVLDVRLVGAQDLSSADATTGRSDPYCIVSVGDSAHRSATRPLTRSPSWDERFQLLVRDVQRQRLQVSVYDADWLKQDDSLGVAVCELGEVLHVRGEEDERQSQQRDWLAWLKDQGSSWRSIELPVEDFGTGRSGGTVQLQVRYCPFDTNRRRSAGDGRDALSFTSNIFSNLRSMLTAGTTEERRRMRRQWEQDLWVLPPEGNWTVLAEEVMRHTAAEAADYEKICFIENAATDTQVCVWRQLESKEVVLAFRGTEQVKWKDIATDVSLVPAGYNVERVGGLLDALRGDENILAHEGFLNAWDSVRSRTLLLVDTITQGQEGWTVYVTGHSLGGALATLCAMEMANSTRVPRLQLYMYNYGSPRVGNAAFAARYNELVPNSFRLVNESDVVPSIPALLGYRHVRTLIRVKAGGTITYDEDSKWETEEPGAGMQSKRAFLTNVVDERQIQEALEALSAISNSEALADHFEDKYYDTLQGCIPKEGEV